MKSFKRFLPVIIAIILISGTAPVNSKYTLSKGYTVGIHGTSNLHDWDETVGTVTGDGVITWNSDGSFDISAINITMVVNSIKSTEGSMMDKNTYKALKADSNPDITLALVSPVKSISTGHAVTAKINLTIAGVTRSVNIPVTASGQKNGSVTLEGSSTIKMTDFGVKPPVALLGTLKTGDDITIHFKTIFAAGN